jgi:hypothetical protein
VLPTPLLMLSILYFLRDVWIRTQRVAVASRRATNLASYLPLARDSEPLLRIEGTIECRKEGSSVLWTLAFY